MLNELNKILEIKFLIDNKKFIEAKKLLRSPLIDQDYYNLFKLQLLVLEEKFISELKISNFLVYSNKNIGEVIHSLLGDYYYSKNKFGNSIVQYKQCLDKNSGNIHASIGIADSFQSLGLNSISEKKYRQNLHLYTWKQDLLLNNIEDESNLDTNSNTLKYDDFNFLPRDLLLNMGLLYRSISNNLVLENDEFSIEHQIFQYLINTSGSSEIFKSYIFVETNHLNSVEFKKSATQNKDDFIKKIHTFFPNFYEKNHDDVNNGKYYCKKTTAKIILKSKKYIVKCIKIKNFTIYSCIPTNIIINENMTSYFYLYLKNLDKNYLKKLLDALGIISDYDDKKMILEYWLKNNNDFKSSIYLQKSKLEKYSDNKLSKNKKNQYLRKIISNQLILKALNEEWKYVNVELILNLISNYLTKFNEYNLAIEYHIVESLVISFEDYYQFLKSQKDTSFGFSFEYLISKLIDKLENIDRDLSKMQTNSPVKKAKLRKKREDFSEIRRRFKKIKTYHDQNNAKIENLKPEL